MGLPGTALQAAKAGDSDLEASDGKLPEVQEGRREGRKGRGGWEGGKEGQGGREGGREKEENNQVEENIHQLKLQQVKRMT